MWESSGFFRSLSAHEHVFRELLCECAPVQWAGRPRGSSSLHGSRLQTSQGSSPWTLPPSPSPPASPPPSAAHTRITSLASLQYALKDDPVISYLYFIYYLQIWRIKEHQSWLSVSSSPNPHITVSLCSHYQPGTRLIRSYSCIYIYILYCVKILRYK